VNRYAYGIDSCSNNGYDYADVFTPDSVFIDKNSEQGFAQGGRVLAKGRQALATRQGGYEDVYVKTKEGWRIQSRPHVRNKAWHNPLLQTADLN
jgi:hypothetical protein